MSSTVNAARPMPFSETLAEALRNDDLSAFDSGTPYATVLLPLLKALGWHNFSRELVEALPHFSDDFDLVTLRNILVSLGYESQPQKGLRISSVNPQLYPCLFVANNGRVLLLIEQCEDKTRYFDADSGKEHLGQLPLVGKGLVYAFTNIKTTHASAARQTPGRWSEDLLYRFRGMIIHLFSMTFLINLVALAVPLAVMLIYDKVISSRSPETLPYLLVGVSIALLVDFGLRQLRARLLGTVAGRIDYLIGVETFKHLLYLPPLFTERSTVAAQLSRLKQFDSVRDFLTGSGASVLLELPFVVISIIVIALIAGLLAWIPVITLLVYLVLSVLLMRPMGVEQQRHGVAKSDKHRLILQILDGRMDIKGIGAEAVWLERFREVSGESASSGYKSALMNEAATAAGQLVMSLAALSVIGWGTFMVMAGGLSIGGLIAVMALVWRILSPMQSAFLNAPQTRQILKSLRQIDQLMKVDVEQQGTHSAHLLSDLEGRIKVERIAFRYGPDQDPALLGVSFDVAAGEILVITGATGSGKSTLLKLIAGMYQSQAGTIAIDDMDIRQLDVSELRRSIAYVPQEVKMFHGTIAQNLRLNNGLASYAELKSALMEAGILDDVLALPEGMDTRIGDNVTRHFPPGFIRGLALARALVRQAPFLLLDEPGTSLDMEADHLFMENLKRMRGRYTIIMVSHRPSHIRLADRAMFMHQGSVKYVGAPQKVIAHLLEQQA